MKILESRKFDSNYFCAGDCLFCNQYFDGSSNDYIQDECRRYRDGKDSNNVMIYNFGCMMIVYWYVKIYSFCIINCGYSILGLGGCGDDRIMKIWSYTVNEEIG
jgi:hypothetical protein